MAVSKFIGCRPHIRSYSKPGQYIGIIGNHGTSPNFSGGTYHGGMFFNDHGQITNQSSINQECLRDIRDNLTGIGIRTIDAFDNQLGDITEPEDYGYPATIWDRPFYTNDTFQLQIYNIPANHLIDMVVAGSNGTANTRGGNIWINDGSRGWAQIVNGNTGRSGPIIFEGIHPEDGIIDLYGELVTNFIYIGLIELRIYRR